ncbi:Ribosome maturation protein SBDS [Oopsacas minuta]|uniref:Ribosome maturation protein SBDS n=1 Tax=Oopsacas minuta TaxID=111878 RepID=A0AAV7K0M0_9METZ|nr:Ribosome maturation protein SBDS [Oopsacas minuta]
MSWREGAEKDLGEVLQIRQIFTNVSKGQFAKKEEVTTAFEGLDMDMDQIIQFILKKGELQVSDKERATQVESTYREIATIVSDKCINPDNNRPYPVGIIEKAMKDIHFNVRIDKSTKKQSLEVIKKLKEKMKIERAQMELRFTLPSKEGKLIKEQIINFGAKIEAEDWQGKEVELIVLADPGLYRMLEDVITKDTKGKGSMEVLNLMVVAEAEESTKNQL